MAAGQPLLSLFSGPIHGISAKHNQGEPQGTDLIPRRLCDLLHGNWEILQERIRGTEHRVFSQADHVVNSSKTTGHQTGRAEASADVRLGTNPARFRGMDAKKAYQMAVCRSASSTLPLLSSLGCWGSSTQVSTFSPVSWSTSVWKVSRGCDWFTDSHKALRRSVMREMGRFGSLKRKNKKLVEKDGL